MISCITGQYSHSRSSILLSFGYRTWKNFEPMAFKSRS